jgi:isoquinoline 1-oxidoreductase subunit beta
MSNAAMTRRDFMQVVAVAGGGFALAVHLPLGDSLFAAEPAPVHFVPNFWLQIDSDGIVTITVHRSELGQGARTALPMIVAEELDADWSKVRITQALADDKYGSMTTGGSTSVRTSWDRLRQAGAAAREMLVDAAATTWKVERASCQAEQGTVVHVPTGRRLGYGALAATAATLPVPEKPPLKDPRNFRILGQRLARLDVPEKVDGSAVFGMDLTLPGMLIATVARCPVFGGRVKSFDAVRARAVPGVRHVLEVPSGVAVLADTTWAAFQAREALRVEWDEGAAATLDSAAIRTTLAAKLDDAATAVRHDGDVAAALSGAAQRLDATYELPFLAHAPMEPMNCTAHVQAGAAEIWAPSQAPQWAQRAVAGALGLPLEKVIVHIPLVGGAFGRRLMFDFAVEAAQVAQAAGVPVKVVWSREDDMRHDFYRPASLHRVAAGLDATGKVVAWSHRIAAPSISAQTFPDQKQEEPDAVDGAAQLPYDIPSVLVDYVMANTAVPVGWWRSVYNTQNAFVNECFVDEVAVAAGVDPLEFRRRSLPAGSRLRHVLELAAEKAGWGTPLPAGRFRGIACHACFGSFVAEVAEVSVSAAGETRVHRVVCAIDAGPIVNPDTIEAQVEGAIALTLGATLHGEITLANGRVQQDNFDSFPMLNASEMPAVEVHIVPSQDVQGGIGEPPLPPLAPAVCNAIFAATGKRVRRLPVRAADVARG